MSMKYIRTMYNVPAKRGGRVRFTRTDGVIEYGTITGISDAHLRVRLDGMKYSLYCHPTWHMEYLDGDNL